MSKASAPVAKELPHNPAMLSDKGDSAASGLCRLWKRCCKHARSPQEPHCDQMLSPSLINLIVSTIPSPQAPDEHAVGQYCQRPKVFSATIHGACLRCGSAALHMPTCASPTFPRITPVPNAQMVGDLYQLNPLPSVAEMRFAPSSATAETV